MAIIHLYSLHDSSFRIYESAINITCPFLRLDTDYASIKNDSLLSHDTLVLKLIHQYRNAEINTSKRMTALPL